MEMKEKSIRDALLSLIKSEGDKLRAEHRKRVEFQLYDIFVQFTSLLSELAFQIAQIASWIITISQYFHNVNNREVPFLFLSVPYCSDLAFIENLNLIFLAHNIIKTSVTGSVCDIVALRTPTSMTELNIFRERATNHGAKLGIIF